jgi:hypothetical protein
VAILGRTPRACWNAFIEHLNPLVHGTLPTHVPFDVTVLGTEGDQAILGFRGTYTIPFKTRRFGEIHVHIGQSLRCTSDSKRSANERYKLGTRKYWYRIQSEVGNKADAIVRWEYVSPTLPEYADHGKRHCWRHMQMSHDLPLPKGKLDLDDAHLPSGYVFIEDVIRFLISDLGVKPSDDDWHDTLIASERKFWHEFITK